MTLIEYCTHSVTANCSCSAMQSRNRTVKEVKWDCTEIQNVSAMVGKKLSVAKTAFLPFYAEW